MITTRNRALLRGALPTLIACLLFLPAAQAQDNEGVATIVKITPKKGHEDVLIKGITDYHKWIAQFDGAMRYTWYQVLTGPDTGKYYARSGDHNWADFDAEYDWQDQADEVFATNVAPAIESMQRMITVDMRDMSIWPEDMSGYTHYAVEHWYIMPGKYGQFRKHLGKIVSTLKEGGFPGYFAFYSVSSGGHGGEIGVVSPHKGWSGMAEENPSFAEIMIKALGSEEAFDEMMMDFGKTFKMGPNMMLRYMQGASDYGD